MIDRYDLGASGYGNAYLCDAANGEVVLYTDHQEVVHALTLQLNATQKKLEEAQASAREWRRVYENQNGGWK